MKLSTLTALATIVGTVALPTLTPAQGPGSRDDRGSSRDRDRRDDRRDDRRNEDRRDRDRREREENRRRDEENRRRDEENRRRAEEQRREAERRRREGERRRDDRRDDRRDGRRGNDGRWDDFRFGGPTGRRESDRRESDRRQQTKNEWRNIAYGAGAVAVLGLLKNDRTLTFAGAAGALYSLHRYEQDRKSQNSIDRARADYFSRPYFVRDGVRYDRKSVSRGGDRYYQFVRGR